MYSFYKHSLGEQPLSNSHSSNFRKFSVFLKLTFVLLELTTSVTFSLKFIFGAVRGFTDEWVFKVY